MSNAEAWATAPPTPQSPRKEIRSTLQARAQRRLANVEHTGDGRWTVFGDDRLGDDFDEYYVRERDDLPGLHLCSCIGVGTWQLCSHILAVKLWKQKQGKVEARARERVLRRRGVLSGGEDEAPGSAPAPSVPASPSDADVVARDPIPPATAARRKGLLILPRPSPEGGSRWIRGRPRSPPPPSPSDPLWDADEPLPAWVEDIRPAQWETVLKVVDAWQRGIKVVFVQAPTGCLAGDTLIKVNRAGCGRTYPIIQLVQMFDGQPHRTGGGGSRRRWNLGIPTRVQRADGDLVRLGTVAAAYPSGVKDLYKLTTRAGRSIRATLEHPFLTPRGWVELGDLMEGDTVMVNMGRTSSPRRRMNYKVVNYLHAHPHAGRRGVKPDKGGYSVPFHRLVAEATINGVDVQVFIDKVRSDDVSKLVFLDPKVFAVHHRDHDHRNNEPSNLEVMSHAAHHRLHSEKNGANVAEHIGTDTVSTIRHDGREETYDLTMVDEPHNFIANEFVVHNSGKTLIADLAMRLAAPDDNGLYIPTTKALQDQVARDFPYPVMKGRTNYRPLGGQVDLWGREVHEASADKADITCADCTKTMGSKSCRWCFDVDLCPYTLARMEAHASRVAVLNTAYWLTSNNQAGGQWSKRGTVVLDEADLLEQELMGHVEVTIRPRRQKELGMEPPPRKTVEEVWGPWVEGEAIPKVLARLAVLPRLDDPAAKPGQIRERKGLERLAGSLSMLAETLPLGGWVYTGYDQGDITFKPVKVDKFGARIWAHGERFLCMSATIISADEMAVSLGLEESYEVVDVPAAFPKENRPVRIVAGPEMTKRNKELGAWDQMAVIVGNLVRLHPDERVLIHTVSYELAAHLAGELRKVMGTRPLFTYGRGWEKDKALEGYKATPGAVLVAASMDRGIDLPDDACRVQIVAKIPFPYLGDKQVNARLHSEGGDLWYQVQAVRTLVQMTGRGVRHATDHAVSYIVDHTFTTNIWKRSRRLLPAWWEEALDWRTMDVRKLTVPLEMAADEEPF